ncbi:MAG: mandelate racemase/muconate lactonizing enzyme family protein [Candidatus Acidiferrales bacterium]|jgi:L-alanine-DL-glutamate epimerase-like enolase superfamily enzyme
MSNRQFSRRKFLRDSALAVAAGSAVGAAPAWANPGLAAAQAVGVKPADLPNLTIKEVKVYVTDMTGIHKLNGTETGEIISVVTEDGIEGNYTLGNRNRTEHWLDWAKPALVGKNILDLLPNLTATSGMKSTAGFDGAPPGAPGGPRTGAGVPGFGSAPAGPGLTPAFGGASVAGSGLSTRGGGSWPNYYTAAADVCMWDILGKAVNRPIYKLLGGGSKNRLMAYASSQHLPSIEDYVPDVLKAVQQNYKGYKIHPGGGQHKDGPPIPSYIGHMEEIRQVRKAVGDEYVLAHDPVQRYNRFEALQVGRLLDELDYLWFEDPVRTSDMDGLIELCATLDLAIHVGEFIYSIADYADYIKHNALTVVRLIADNVGGIFGSMRVGLLADAFGLECTPHNWGNMFDLALHFHVELALPNAYWFEMPFPAEYADRPYSTYKFRPDADGYIPAPTEPGLGYPLDRAALDKMTLRIDR